MKAIAVSHKGKRDINQDLILEYTSIDGSYLFAVIDGMGGYENGEIAAKIISENIETYLSTIETIDAYHIQKAINKSNLAIRQQKSHLSDIMGATIGGVVIKGSNIFYFWVGDVKIFHLRNKKLLFESKPHSMINELIANNSIMEPLQLSKYKHVVTRSIHGESKTSIVEIRSNNFMRDSDIVIVCSDGVHDLIDSFQIENILQQVESPAHFSSNIESRLKKEARDNYSYGII